MPTRPRPAQYFAVRLRLGRLREVNGMDFAGFIDQMRYDQARVVLHPIGEREAVWIVLEAPTCTRDRWRSFGIPVIGPHPSAAETSARVSAHLQTVEAALS